MVYFRRYVVPKIDYRGLIVIFGLVLLSVFLVWNYAPSNSKAPISKPTQVIVIDICSLRADHVGAYGYNRPTTPNLDEFAKQATTFNNFWTESGWCLPNFATMLTGTRPEVHQLTFVSSQLSASITTLAEILGNNGFATAGFSGSRYLSPNTSTRGLDKGFQTFINPYTSEADTAMGAASYSKNEAAVQKWIADNKDKPFFLYVTIDDLHSPYTHADNPKLFDPNYSGILDTVNADLFFTRVYNGETNVAGADEKTIAGVKEFKKDPKNLANLIARYDAGIVTVDSLAGRLFQTLKENGLLDNSLIIVTAHQGEQLGEHGQLGHITGIYEPILSVPFFIRYPGVADNGARISKLAERIDIPATILDTAGLLDKYKAQYTGTSLLPLLRDPATAWKEFIFASSKPTWIPSTGEPSIEERAVRNDRYKLLWYGYKKPAYELYDLQTDPGETKNLADKLPDVFSELKSQLDSYAATNTKK